MTRNLDIAEDAGDFFENHYSSGTFSGTHSGTSTGTHSGPISTSATFPAGHVIQHVYNQTGAVATGTTIFSEDDTIPQITEGHEFLTQAITPKQSTSTISIEVHIFYSQSTGTRSGCGLFKDSNADALAFTSNYIGGATSMGNMQVFYAETSGNTTARTYRVRCGLIQSSGTFTLNGQGGARKFGGAALSTIRIMEIAG